MSQTKKARHAEEDNGGPHSWHRPQCGKSIARSGLFNKRHCEERADSPSTARGHPDRRRRCDEILLLFGWASWHVLGMPMIAAM